MDKIFIQIASFRDPQLIPTVEDILAKAKYPERLTFGIVWQYSEEDKWDDITDYMSKENFSVLKVHYTKSPGLGWARSKTQKMWKGEKYTLQIDSHMRFAENWDEELIYMLKQTGVEKPIITTYGTMYDPENDFYHEGVYKINPDHFTDRETLYCIPEIIHDWEKYKKPIPSFYVSGHFFFTLGIHTQEYKYDPLLFFTGDEISLSTRSFTLGYDIFRPNKPVVWHYYIRRDSNRIFGIKNQNLQKTTVERLNKLWNNPEELGEYGMGSVRKIEDWENYSGISLKSKSMHIRIFNKEDPPLNLEEEKDWREKYKSQKFNYKVEWSNLFNEEIFKDLTFIYIGFFDKDDKQIYRMDLDNYNILNGQIREQNLIFSSSLKPFKFRVWPHSKTDGWLDYKEVELEDNNG